jgi:hypothetical protein
MRNISGKFVKKIKRSNFVFIITFFRKWCHLLHSVEKCGRLREATDDNIIQRMHFQCWITKATNTHSEYVIRIALPRLQWLRECASMLCYTFIACLVKFTTTKCSFVNISCIEFDHIRQNRCKVSFRERALALHIIKYYVMKICC